MSRQLKLAFGRHGLDISLPDGFDYVILDAKSAPPLADPDAALDEALDHPIASPPLAALARGKSSAAISVCDITRPAPNRAVLPHVLKRLKAAGIERSRIVILIATGLHRPATENEIREIAGEEIAANYRVENHDARRREDHRFLGNTKSGTPAWIDERFAAADLRITLGFIEPHLMAGYSGGRKLVVPGLAAQETIKTLHSPRFMREPLAIEGSIADNPLHRELVEIAAMAGHQFIVDVALARDRRIAQVFAGDPVEAHRQGVAFVGRALLEEIEKPVDAVITTGAGYPLDLTWYQCVKGITAASHIVREGGRILIAGACPEGCGSPEFTRLTREYADPRSCLDGIANAEVTVDQWQLEKLALVATRASMFYCVPGLDANLRARLWGRAFDNIQCAVDAVLEGLPAGSRVGVIPEGPYTLARVARAA